MNILLLQAIKFEGDGGLCPWKRSVIKEECCLIVIHA
jgi:hypothetical protein